MRDYGKEENRIVEFFDIRQMLTILKWPDWEKIPPLKYYFTPLKESFDAVVKCLLDMRTAGVLRCSYHVEQNSTLLELVRTMIRNDVTA